MSDPLFDSVSEVERQLKVMSSTGHVTLADYVKLVDRVAAENFCDKAELHEEVRSSLGDAFGIEMMESRAPGR